jgi:hypothetical protein
MVLKRRHFLDNNTVQIPFPDRPSVHEIMEEHNHVFAAVQHPLRELIGRWPTWLVLVGVIPVLFYLHHRFVATAEGAWYDRTLKAGFALFVVALLVALLYARLLWKRLRRLLRQIVLLPMAPAFGRIPGMVTSLFGPYLSSPRHRDRGRVLRLQQLSALVEQALLCREDLEVEFSANAANSLTGRPARYLRNLLCQERQRRAPADAAEPPEQAEVWDERLCQAAEDCLPALEHYWAARSVGATYGEIQGECVRKWVQLAEDFVAIEVVNYLSQFFVQIRSVVTFLMVGVLLLLLVVLTYPF